MTKMLYLIKIKKANLLILQLLDKSKAQSPYNDNNKQPINFITQNNNNSNDQHQKNIQLKTEAKI